MDPFTAVSSLIAPKTTYRHAALILNAAAGSSFLAAQNRAGEDLETVLLQMLREQNIEAEVYYTTPEDPGETIARQLAARHTKLIVVAGGDGTIHAVARGLLGSSCTLGIIPAGTMNNLARSLGIPADLQEACAVLKDGEARAIDVGSINHHLFLEVAGVGLEAMLYPAAEAIKTSDIFSMLLGAASGLWTLLRPRLPVEVSISFDQERARTYRVLQITACNAPYYGVHLNVAPGIIMNDGWLDIVLYTNFSKSEYLRHAISISQGRRPLTPKIVHRRARSLRIYSQTPLELHADGTVIGTTPAEISIIPGALRVLVPAQPGPGLIAKKEPNAFLRFFRRKEKIDA